VSRSYGFGKILLGIGVGLLGATCVLAQNGPQIEELGGVRYVSGGVGASERDELEAVGRSFNLKLVFATRDGHYLSDVAVRIVDARNNVVLDADSEGPLFYVELRPGAYSVSASGFGHRLDRRVTVGADKQTQLVFHWPWAEKGSAPY
jgi:hypothetical protein